MNGTTKQRRRHEVPPLQWQHWLPGGQTWKARHWERTPNALILNAAKRCFVAFRRIAVPFMAWSPHGMVLGYQAQPMHILGITGGIATGKSTVTRMLAELGAPTISADVVARALLAPGTPTTVAVLAAFPACGDTSEPLKINRRALAQIIFADADARRQLEALTHPLIIQTLRVQIAEWRAHGTARAGAAEIPLLFEVGSQHDLDKIVVAACAEPLQAARLCARDGIGEDEAGRQIAAQWPLSEKKARADFVVTTDGDLEDTRRQVSAIWESL